MNLQSFLIEHRVAVLGTATAAACAAAYLLWKRRSPNGHALDRACSIQLQKSPSMVIGEAGPNSKGHKFGELTDRFWAKREKVQEAMNKKVLKFTRQKSVYNGAMAKEMAARYRQSTQGNQGQGQLAKLASMNLFGVPLTQMQLISMDGKKIPEVLHLLQVELEKKDAYTLEGIFRIAPEVKEVETVLDEMINGSIQNACDMAGGICCAHLIKRWFRELLAVDDVWSPVGGTQVVLNWAEDEGKDLVEVVLQLPTKSRDLLLWLLELMAVVVSHEDENKMMASNVATVLAPNLFNAPLDMPLDQMEKFFADSLTFTQNLFEMYHAAQLF